MSVFNIGVDKILTDSLGKTSTNIMKYLIEHKTVKLKDEKVKSLLNKGLKKKSNQIIKSIKLYNNNSLNFISIFLLSNCPGLLKKC